MPTCTRSAVSMLADFCSVDDTATEGIVDANALPTPLVVPYDPHARPHSPSLMWASGANLMGLK